MKKEILQYFYTPFHFSWSSWATEEFSRANHFETLCGTDKEEHCKALKLCKEAKRYSNKKKQVPTKAHCLPLTFKLPFNFNNFVWLIQAKTAILHRYQNYQQKQTVTLPSDVYKDDWKASLCRSPALRAAMSNDDTTKPQWQSRK